MPEDDKILDKKMKDARDLLEKTNIHHKFWDTQPVLKAESDITEIKSSGPIEKDNALKNVRKIPFRLPEGFFWDTFDVNDDKDLTDFYELLEEHYVEDEDHVFRLNYSKEFLKWALCPPGYKSDWHLTIRSKNRGKMIASITAIPVTAIIDDKKMNLAEINFLCVNKHFREKRISPVLIKEITRRVNSYEIWQAIYTIGMDITLPFSQSRYYHRQLKPKKLVEIGFSETPSRAKMKSMIRQMHLDSETTLKSLRPLKESDIPSATKLLNSYLSRYRVRMHFTEEEFVHWFSKREGVIETYVISNEEEEVTDLLSFYILPSTVLDNAKYNEMFAVYSFYNVATTTSLEELIQNSLILAKNKDDDVFNMLDMMDNYEVFDSLKFHKGDGVLRYYIFNWKLTGVKATENSMIMF